MGDLINGNGNGYSGTSCPKGSYWNGIECVSSGHSQMTGTGGITHPYNEPPIHLQKGGSVKKANRPVRRSMANGGVAKAKPASRSTCCRGNGGRAAPKPASRRAPRSAPLRGGSRSGGVR